MMPLSSFLRTGKKADSAENVASVHDKIAHFSSCTPLDKNWYMQHITGESTNYQHRERVDVNLAKRFIIKLKSCSKWSKGWYI